VHRIARAFVDEWFGIIPLLPLFYLSLQQGESLGDDELQAMIDEFDSTGAGEIDEKDFLKIMKQTSIY
jgi:Ca2+-binding EF-hand superfamily protein